MDVQDVITQARDAITVKRVFGEPYERNGVTVIPVARVKGTETIDRRLDRCVRRIGPPSCHGRFAPCCSPFCISCCVVWSG